MLPAGPGSAKAAAKAVPNTPTPHRPKTTTSDKITAPTMSALPGEQMDLVLKNINYTHFNEISLSRFSIQDKADLSLASL